VVAGHAGVTRREYDEYFSGAKKAVGIFLGKARQQRVPIALSRLRDLINGFSPPQSFRYLREMERSALCI
jgi:predicted transcriptional regulator